MGYSDGKAEGEADAIVNIAVHPIQDEGQSLDMAVSIPGATGDGSIERRGQEETELNSCSCDALIRPQRHSPEGGMSASDIFYHRYI